MQCADRCKCNRYRVCGVQGILSEVGVMRIKRVVGDAGSTECRVVGDIR